MPADGTRQEARPLGRARRPLVLTHAIWSPHALLRFAATGAALAALLTLVAVWVVDTPPTLDVAVSDALAEHRTRTSIGVARVLTFLGDLWVVAAISAALVVIARRRAGHWDIASLVVAVVGGSLAVTGVVKVVTARARPDGALVDALSSAFPSGHASRAAAVYALVVWLAVRWIRSRATRATVIGLAVAMALATGVARLVLGIHWATDVLAGWALGVVWLVAALAITRPHRVDPPAV